MLQFHFYSINAGLFDRKEFPALSVNDQPPNAVSIYVPGLTPRTMHQSHWFAAARGLEENFERTSLHEKIKTTTHAQSLPPNCFFNKSGIHLVWVVLSIHFYGGAVGGPLQLYGNL